MESKLSDIVFEFAAAHVGDEFTSAELANFVEGRRPGTSPASADRILRKLRNAGCISYYVPDRSRSRYIVSSVH